MADQQDTANFNVKAVAVETGLKPDTLRAWERRYGLPVPSRSAGGHRLYSQRDIDTLKWLVARQEEGLTISNAVDLWNHLKEGGKDPLTMAEYGVASSTRRADLVVTGESVSELRRNWVEACLEFNESAAEQILSQAFAVYPVETVVLEILRAGVAEIGNGWFRGDVVVQQEHFASQLGLRRLEALLASTPPPSRPERVLLVCPPGEQHTFGLLLLALLLRRRGYSTIYLGANVPIARLQEAIDTAKPRLVVAVAQLVDTAASLREMGLFLAESGVPLAYGGRIFVRMPELRDQIPGSYLGDLIREAPDKLESIIAHPRHTPLVKSIPEGYRAALTAFRGSRPLIDHRVTESLHEQGVPSAAWQAINEYMADGISAALRLGNLAILDQEIDWVSGLLSNFGGGEGQLTPYLKTYHEAAREELPTEAEPILEWFDRHTS
jgi:DNA-binding transcriptional MerR regulator